jgi:hypothetical protein
MRSAREAVRMQPCSWQAQGAYAPPAGHRRASSPTWPVTYHRLQLTALQ